MKFQGIWPIMPTPLTLDEDVDEPALRQIIRHVIEGGVHGLWMLGSGGEQPMLTLDVQRRVLEIAVEEAKGHVPVIAGVGSPSLRRALVSMRMAQEAGVDAVQSVEPYYYGFSRDEIVDYFLALADASELPVVVYHGPARWPPGSVTAANLPKTLGRIAAHPNVIGMKFINRDTRDVQRIVFTLGSEDFTIMTAAGRLLFNMLVLGGHGGAFAEAVVVPRLYVELYDAFNTGDLLHARELQRKLAPLGDVFATFSPGAPSLKQAVSLLGLCDVHVARPRHGMSEEGKSALKDVMKSLELI